MRLSRWAHPGPGRRGLRAAFTLGIAVTLTAPACTSDRPDVPPGTSEVSVRDSAGVEIVEIPRGTLEGLPVWRLSGTPLLSIGEIEGAEEYLFGRITQARRTDSGLIVVYDSQARQLRVYDAEGRFARDLGRNGEGPGEYGGVNFLDRLSDGRVAASDLPLSRAILFDPETGEHETRRFPCDRGGGASSTASILATCFVQGMIGAENVVVTSSIPGESEPDPGPNEVQHRTAGSVIVAVSGPADAAVLDTLPTGASWLYNVGGNNFTGGDGLFQVEGQYGIGPDGVVLGPAGAWEVSTFDPAGNLRRILRVSGPLEPLTDAVMDRIRTQIDTMHPVLRPAADQYLAEFDRPTRIPAYGELRLDAAGRLWVADYKEPASFRPSPRQDWTIFDADGLPIGRMATGPSAEVLDLGEDWLLRREEDDLGVQRVVLYALERGGAP